MSTTFADMLEQDETREAVMETFVATFAEVANLYCGYDAEEDVNTPIPWCAPWCAAGWRGSNAARDAWQYAGAPVSAALLWWNACSEDLIAAVKAEEQSNPVE